MPLSRLNEEQTRAATADLGYNLIIASAGTGKTSTIVARISYLLQSGIRPEEILLLTFTNKASKEMIQRVSNYFNDDIVKNIEAGTFHSVSYKLLKRYSEKVVLKQPKDLKILLKSVYEKRVFHHLESSAKVYRPSYLYDLFSLYQNSSHEKLFSEWLIKRNGEQEIYADIYEDIFEEFKNLKNKFGYMDYNDLLINMISLAKKEHIFFKEILVDEYQDTNPLQNDLIDSFEKESLFCVGDYDQSIYAFNGADIKIIASFKDRYKNARVFTLNKNYRSTKEILSLANRVIRQNPRIYKKELVVTKEQKGMPPTLYIFEEVYEQYAKIAQKIRNSTNDHKDIAVIFRNNASADGMEAALRELYIGCKRKGSMGFFETKEIKTAINIISIFTNPKDIMAFVNVFEYAKGIGSVIGKEIFEALYELGDKNSLKGLLKPDKSMKNPFKKRVKNYQLGLFDDFEYLGSVARFKDMDFEENFLSNPILKHPKISTEGANFIYSLYKFAKQNKRVSSPYRFIDNLLNSELLHHIIDTLARQRSTRKNSTMDENLYNEAKANITRRVLILKELAKNYDNLTKMINALVLGSSEISEGEGVNLLSVHASKGLEFKEVYIIDLMDGRFPNKKLASQGGSIEEERRLFYVATTRAKDLLYLSCAKYDKIKKQKYEPSIFLKEASLIHA